MFTFFKRVLPPVSLIFAIAVTACNSEKEGESPLKTEKTARERFGSIVENLFSDPEALLFPVPAEAGNKDRKLRWKPDYRYDIHEAGSTGVPFAATLVVPCDLYQGDELINSEQQFILRFGYSEGRWSLVEAHREGPDGVIGEESDEPQNEGPHWLEKLQPFLSDPKDQ